MTYEDNGFSLRRFSALTEISETHFWFAGRQALIQRILDRYVPEKVENALDIGCGPGRWLSSWLRYAKDVCGIDPFAENVTPNSLVESTRIISGVASELPVEDASADLVLALDVLEHIEDMPALREMHRALRPDGYVMITVPAFPWLWSFRDEDAGHLRRYTRQSLLAAIETAGFQARHVQYYQSLLFPVVILSRLLGRRASTVRDTEDRPPEWLNRILRRVNLFEVNAGLRLPFGSSLLALVQKEVS